jgi:uncharacterized membrane protein
MNLNVYIICIAAVALLAVPAMADNNTATINGGVYSWDTFEPLENALVEVNSTPSQSMVARYGLYSFELEPGDYLITASYYENSTLVKSSEKSIEVKGNGSYNVDLLLVPVYSTELMGSSGSEEKTSVSSKGNDTVSNLSTAETSETDGVSATSTVYYFIAALMLSLLLAGGYTFQKHKIAEKKVPENKRLEKHHPETNKLEKSRFLEENEKYETERVSLPVSVPEISVKESSAIEPAGKVEPKTGLELPVKLIETQFSEGSEFKMEKEDKETFAEEISSEEDLEEISLKEPVQEPEPVKTSEPETSKKNLPLPADLQEIMDIIRGQGGRITQKDLRSKLKYSEGKVSLMLADLERRELIEKFKRGRGNVIIIRDEER